MPVQNSDGNCVDNLVRSTKHHWNSQHGWKRDEVAAWIQGQDCGSILEKIESAVRLAASHEGNAINAAERADDLLQRACLNIRLLAAGIVGQYQSVRRGMPVIQNNTLDPMLSRAMMGLASLYLLEGQEDVAGSVHELLTRCALPLHDPAWGLDIFSSVAFPYHTLRLIDPDARLPTLDCIELASQTRSELDLREQLAFEALRIDIDLLIPDDPPVILATRTPNLAISYLHGA